MPESPTDSIVSAEIVQPNVDVGVLAPHGLPCEACGAPVESSDRFCTACGCPVSRPSETATDQTTGAGAPDELSQKFFRCKNCGSEVATDPDQRSYVCPFCDSTYVVEFTRELSGRQPPEYVIGFAITPDEAQNKFRQWIKENSWFRPGNLRLARIEEKLKGVYLPFWSFSMLADSRWSSRIGEYWYRTETYWTTDSKGKRVQRTRRVRETEWWPLAGNHHQYYSGFLVSGSRGLTQADAERIKPFNLPALNRYEPLYLAGWLSEEYSVPRDEALEVCQQTFYDRERANVAAFMPGDTYGDLQISTEFDHINSDLCLLPAYILSYRFGDKLYRFMVNGQTGKMAGDKPVSGRRIALVVGIVVLLVGLVWLLIVLLSS